MCARRAVSAGCGTTATERRSAGGSPTAFCCAQRRQLQPSDRLLRQRGSFTTTTVTNSPSGTVTVTQLILVCRHIRAILIWKLLDFIRLSNQRRRQYFWAVKTGYSFTSNCIQEQVRIQIVDQISCVCVLNKCLSSSQGEYIASAKGLQLEVYFFKKQKAYRWATMWDASVTRCDDHPTHYFFYIFK